jgi:uncharacterized membrane protein YgcG
MSTPYAVFLQPPEERVVATLVDQPFKRRRRSHVRYHDILQVPPASTLPVSAPVLGSTLSDLATVAAAVSAASKSSTYLCPLAHCQKVFHYRSVRDRHVQNVHGAVSSTLASPNDTGGGGGRIGRGRGRPRGSGRGKGGGRGSRLSHLSELNPDKFIWNELLGVAV